MRLIPRFAPLLLGLCAAGPAFAGIAPTINVQILSTGATTEDVAVTVPLHRTTTADCPAAGPNQCLRTRISLRVVPTPLGLPDTNGGYNVTYFDETTPINFTLTRGQAYALTSQVKFDVGKPAPGGVCNAQCTFNADLQASYTATPIPPVYVPPTWDVSYDSYSGDMAWVTIRMIGLNLNNACSQLVGCAEHEIFGKVTPCPLDVAGTQGSFCDGGEFGFHGLPGGSVQVALQIGKSYAISGYHYTVGLGGEMGNGPCSVPVCDAAEQATDKVILVSPIATRPITWGAVKAMYRQ